MKKYAGDNVACPGCHVRYQAEQIRKAETTLPDHDRRSISVQEVLHKILEIVRRDRDPALSLPGLLASTS